ncbi:hypothetical protein [Williamsia sp.]|uniref:hypothetical protein n=1 Tax=Williamsia sp. TaxID=1872085 RepID=UPI001A198097|nr:hypothetical protein [Williamsia sp.]MBJ7288543.1 hypothetical protein [Williamsia sp.]
MKSLPAVLAAAVGAAVAVVSLLGPTTFQVFDSAFVGSRWDSFFNSSAAFAAAAVLVALVVAVSLRHLVIALVGAAVGLIALAILAFTMTNEQGIGYPTAIAGGLVLGSLAVVTHPNPSTGGRAGRIGLAAGVVAGFLLAQSVQSSFGGFGGNRRSADYGVSTLVAIESNPRVATLVGAVIALIALLVFASQIRGTTSVVIGRPDTTVIIAGVGVPVAVVLLSFWLHESGSTGGGISPPGWVFGSVAIVIVLTVALVMPGRTGLAWVGAVALVATGAAADVSDVGGPVVVVVAVLIGLGAAAARWRNLLPVGIAVLVVVVLFQLVHGDSSVLVAAAGALFVAPIAASYTVAVCMSDPASSQPLAHPAIIATAVSACVPLSALRGGADFGWTAYTPLTDAPPDIDQFGFQSATETTVATSVLSLIAAGVAAWIITRRPHEPVTAPLAE